MNQEIIRLENLVNEYEYAYRVLDNPIVSDEIFDKTKKELEILSKQYPEFVTSNSPLNKIGSVLVDGFKKVKHDRVMGSIENVYSIEELTKWADSISKKLNRPLDQIEMVIEDKYDGCSGSIHIANGIIQRAATRGDGRIGDDITENAKMIWNYNDILKVIGNDFTGEIRGEFIIFKESFNKVCKQENNAFKNPRNLVSGTIKSLDSTVVRNRYVQFMLFEIFDATGKRISLNNEKYNFAKVVETIDEYQKSKTYKNRPYMVDGAVIKLASMKDRELLGYTSDCPVWAKAFKFKQEKAITKVKSITWQCGRDRITPVAELESVDLEGSTISRATIHNITQLRRLGVVPGCFVEIEKAGYIIPYINKVVENKTVQNVEIPTTCPICHHQTQIKKIEAEYLICTNENCIGKLAARVEHFVKTLKIDNVGEGIIAKLIDNKLISRPIDIFKLTYEQLLHMDKMGKTNASKIYNNIQKALVQPIKLIIASLGIPDVGETTSEKLGNQFKTISDFMSCDFNMLRSIENIGDVVAENIMEFINKNQALLHQIDELFIVKKETAQSTVLSGMKFVITGAATKSRDELELMVKRNGGECSGSVSKKTDCLIIGSKEDSSFNSNKKKKALDLNIPIVDEFWLFEKISVTFDVKDDKIEQVESNDLNNYF